LHHGHYQAIVPLRRPINLQIALGLNRHHDPMHDLNKPRLITNRFTNMMSCWFHQSCHKSTLKDTNTHTHTHIFQPMYRCLPIGTRSLNQFQFATSQASSFYWLISTAINPAVKHTHIPQSRTLTQGQSATRTSYPSVSNTPHPHD